MRYFVQSCVMNCQACSTHRFKSPDNIHKWHSEEAAWHRIHMDWAFAKTSGEVLVIADSYGGWMEAIQCPNRKSSTVITLLRHIFARFGVPYTLVCDNAREFDEHDLRNWLQHVGCRMVHSPDRRPQCNGLAERMVRVVKTAVRCYNPAKSSFDTFLWRIIFVHRNTAQRGDSTPAQLLIAKEVRCPIIGKYRSMENVLYRPSNQQSPSQVTFLFKQGGNTSLVAHPNGRSVLAHDAQLSPISIPPPIPDRRINNE